jgi:AcrR family transcriptional regulator
MAHKGIAAASIQEITDTADVGFGSFYNHFESKEAIAEAVMEEALESFGEATDRLTAAIEDPAEVLAVAVRSAVLRAATDPGWGWFLIRTALARSDALQAGLGQRLARDVKRGISKRRFQVDDPVAAVLAVGGVILAFIAGRLHGDLGDEAPRRAATVVLKMLGLPADEALALAKRPLPAPPATA